MNEHYLYEQRHNRSYSENSDILYATHSVAAVPDNHRLLQGIVMPLHFIQDQTKTLTNTMPWSIYGRVSMLEKWVDELRTAADTDTKNQPQWDLVGRAVMVAHPDKTQHKEIIAKVAVEANYNLIELNEDKFMEWVETNHVPEDSCPALVYVPQGVWSAKYETTDKAPENVQAFRSKLGQYLDGLAIDLALCFVTSGDSYANLDPELRNVGQFDRRFEISEHTLETKGDLFLDKIGRGNCDETLLGFPEKVGYLIEDEFSGVRGQSLIALSMKRIAHQQSRKVGFDDLVQFALFGGGETDHPQNSRPDFTKRVAVHEAGHALVAILDSDFKNIPDYVGIIASSNSGGKVSDSYHYNLDHYGQRTFRYIKHSIRVFLAGRIAESIVLGAEEVSFWGARSDLLNASRIAKDLIGKAGFGTDYGEEHPDDVNLLVADDEFGVPEDIYAARNARTFLRNQYIETENLLNKNRGLLDYVSQALIEKKVLNNSEILKAVDDYKKSAPRS